MQHRGNMSFVIARLNSFGFSLSRSHVRRARFSKRIQRLFFHRILFCNVNTHPSLYTCSLFGYLIPGMNSALWMGIRRVWTSLGTLHANYYAFVQTLYLEFRLRFRNNRRICICAIICLFPTLFCIHLVYKKKGDFRAKLFFERVSLKFRYFRYFNFVTENVMPGSWSYLRFS